MPVDQKQQIEAAIKRFADGDLFENALNLFNALKYNNQLQAPLDDPSWEGFRQLYVSTDRFNEKTALASDWKYVNILFQLSGNAIKQQIDIFSSGHFDSSIMYSFLYICIELSKDNYTKTQLSQITREINKVFAMPVMVLFKTSSFLTLSLINRRLHKRDDTKDVLEKVTLIKDISILSPHRAHIEILFDVSFNELYRKHGFSNFVELHQAWQKTLDTKELNKRFFKELFNWYLWAIKNVRFPNKVDDATDDMIFNQEAVIRLLTRLIFIWFIKEKNLVQDHLFNVRFLRTILREFDPQSLEKSDYYRAILQNLFFATLNTPMDKDIKVENRDEKRGFIVPGMPGGRANPHYTDQTRYRYKEYFLNEEQARKLFETIPFLNGGLFECLDFPPEDGQPEIRIDGFSTKKDKQAFVPDMLFFNEEFILDLNEEYGTKGKQYKVKGLIPIFSGYKFTITENTPLEEEVALDPELLGKVFENLLATYNPETRTTARKQTGSFYTPREIVNYMVDESLIAFINNALAKDQEGPDSDKEETEQRLRYLFSPEGEGHDFNEEETGKLIHALSHCRILDPACGSGAFPMGILHRMVDLLGKLDPENNHWKAIQKDRAIQETKEAYEIGNQDERHHRLEEINKAFDEGINNPDYARKLFLIENCIYGVDIQQIAVQIAKLRFFISLIAEQKVDDSKPNRNILSMPNLETKFVAANTLIGLEMKTSTIDGNVGSMFIGNPEVEYLQKELQNIRHKIFFARKYLDKRNLKKTEKEIRYKLQLALTESGYNEAIAAQMISWNPFDPLKSSPFFDVETMFGFTGGFDVVIGNPPYVEAKKLKTVSQVLRKLYTTYSGTADLYVYFYENGLINLKPGGILVFITSNKFIKTSYGENLRKYFTSYKINKIIDFADIHLFEALVASCVFSITKKISKKNSIVVSFANDTLLNFNDLHDFVAKNHFLLNQNSLSERIWQLEDETRLLLKEKIENNSISLKDSASVSIYRGVTTGYNPAFIINKSRRDYLILEDVSAREIIKPILQGRNIRRWIYNSTDSYLIFTRRGISILDYTSIHKYLLAFQQKLMPGKGRKPGNYYWYEIQDNTAYYSEFEKEKIIWGLTSDKWTFAYDNQGNYLPSNGYILTSSKLPIKYLLALMNSKLMEFYFGFIGIMTAGNAFTLKYETVIEFPIKSISEDAQKPFIALVEQILDLKKNDNEADVEFLEQKIDERVYKLYGLTYEEVKIIDPDFWLTELEYEYV